MELELLLLLVAYKMLLHLICTFPCVSNSCLVCCHELNPRVSDLMWKVTSVPIVRVQVQFPHTPVMFTAVKGKGFINTCVFMQEHFVCSGIMQKHLCCSPQSAEWPPSPAKVSMNRPGTSGRTWTVSPTQSPRICWTLIWRLLNGWGTGWIVTSKKLNNGLVSRGNRWCVVSVLGSMLFSTFIDNGVKHTCSKCAADTRLSWLVRGHGWYFERHGQAGGVDPCELHEVQEGQVKGPAHGSGQSSVSVEIGGVRAALQRSALGYCWMTAGTRAANIHLLPRLRLGLHNK